MRVHFGLEWISVIMFIAFYKHATGTNALNEDLWLWQYVVNKAQSPISWSLSSTEGAISQWSFAFLPTWVATPPPVVAMERRIWSKVCYSFSCQLYSRIQRGLGTRPTRYCSWCEVWCIYAWAEYLGNMHLYGHYLWLHVNVCGVGTRRESSKRDSDVRLRSINTIKNISAWIWLAPDWYETPSWHG